MLKQEPVCKLRSTPRESPGSRQRRPNATSWNGCNHRWRQRRAHGAPLGSSAEDREGLRNAVRVMRGLVSTVFLGGHSYGGRQASMLAAEEVQIAAGLLLLSYPLHPPRNPSQLRTAHFPSLRTPALFVHGARDPFGSLSEMEAALKLLAGQTRLLAIEGVGHELKLGTKKGSAAGQKIPQQVLATFREFFR